MQGRILRLCLLLLCLTAATTQAWTSQLHVHLHGGTHLAGIAPSMGSDTGNGQDGNGCLLCQIVAHGAALALHSSVPPLPRRVDLGLDAPPPRVAIAGYRTPSHHWWGRGPPRG